MDMEIEYFLRHMEMLSTNKHKFGHPAPGRLRDIIADGSNLPDIEASGVCAEMTGVMPASLQRGDEMAAYHDLFPRA